MPCNGGPSEYEERRDSDERMRKTIAQRDLATRLLCELASKIPPLDHRIEANPELQAWLKEHEKIDAARIKKEAEDAKREAEQAARNLEFAQKQAAKAVKDAEKALALANKKLKAHKKK